MQHIHGGAKRAPQPVRRGSRERGTFERGWWVPIDRRAGHRLVEAARRYERARRLRGRPSGPLGHVAIELLELLVSLADRRTGRLDPSILWLMSRLRRSRDAIARAMTRLRDAGFLEWARRFDRIDGDGPGPRVRQASNAYRMALPDAAARLLPRPAPLPDDVAQATDERAAWIDALPVVDLVTAKIDDTALARALALMATRVRPADRSR